MPPVKTSLLSRLKADAKSIAADIVSVGVVVQAALVSVTQLATSVHLPAPEQAIITAASAVVTTVIAEARRIVASK